MIIYILLLVLAYFISSICFGSWTTRKMIPKQKGEWTDERISAAMKKNGITLTVMLVLLIVNGFLGWYVKGTYFLLFFAIIILWNYFNEKRLLKRHLNEKGSYF
ncbi:MAG TPA: hypothetical protein VK044_00255 [Virgibacillus sp.]|nr:hypothetical protein [Virgibacillus sp.]